MRDVILVQKIVELMSVTRAARSQHAQSRKLAIPTDSAAAHNERIDDRLANGRNFCECAPKFGRRNVEYLGLIRCDSGRTEDRRALQHRYVAHEIALARVSQIVFGSVARLERFEFAAQNNCQSEIALPGLKDEIATLHDTTLSEGLKQRKLMIVQFWKGDAFSIAVEPFVLLVVSHLRNLRVT